MLGTIQYAGVIKQKLFVILHLKVEGKMFLSVANHEIEKQ
jgi:hypothetical protein